MRWHAWTGVCASPAHHANPAQRAPGSGAGGGAAMTGGGGREADTHKDGKKITGGCPKHGEGREVLRLRAASPRRICTRPPWSGLLRALQQGDTPGLTEGWLAARRAAGGPPRYRLHLALVARRPRHRLVHRRCHGPLALLPLAATPGTGGVAARQQQRRGQPALSRRGRRGPHTRKGSSRKRGF